LAWTISLTPRAQKELAKLDKETQKRIFAFLRERVSISPRERGSPLTGHLREFWRWRVGDYRVLAKIEDDQVLVLVVHIGHRSKVYGGH
jgi:mRNA interferase RelE/StbE